MKKVLSLLFVMTTLLGVSKVTAQSKTESFKVFGNCGMCKKRVEKALAVDGIAKADWNVETKMMTVTYDTAKISNEAIQKKIAAVGHDTEKEKAADAVYNKLPGCCQYDRAATAQPAHHEHHK